MANAWLVLAAGEDRQHGGNDGYDDDPASTYRWDNTVSNHALIASGDAIVLWDKRLLIGASVVEDIDEDDTVKNVNRCTNCGKASIKKRRRLQPEWRCADCRTVFDIPAITPHPVHTYASRHDVGWVDLYGVLTGAQLRKLCLNPKSQLSLRQLDWPAFRAAIENAWPGKPLTLLEFRGARIRGGHSRATVRVRRGQAAFRTRLLAQHGAICAITGPAPAATLEAGHLYSYAAVGDHDEHGGLLLRRDVHRLFDLGQLAIDPATLSVDVHAGLADYEHYAVLHGKPLAATLAPRHRRWLRAHWEQHRGAAS